jgi:hypothetical protein
MTQIIPYQAAVSRRISNEPYLADTERRYGAIRYGSKPQKSAFSAVSVMIRRGGSDPSRSITVSLPFLKGSPLLRGDQLVAPP